MTDRGSGRLHLQPTLVGKGPPAIVQGPAWGPSSEYLRLTLVPLLEGLRVVTFDPRNVGQSPRLLEEDAQATANLVGDLEELRRRLGLERFVLVGHSHGGFVAMGYAVRHAERLRGMILLDTSLRGPACTAETRKIVEELSSDPARAEAVKLYCATGGLPPASLASDAEFSRWLRQATPVFFYDLEALGRFQGALRNSRRPSVDALHRMPPEPEAWVGEGLPEVEVPSLVLTGRYDVAAPPSESEEICRRLPGAELVIIERGGHQPWVEQPNEFRAAIRGFLRKLP